MRNVTVPQAKQGNIQSGMLKIATLVCEIAFSIFNVTYPLMFIAYFDHKSATHFDTAKTHISPPISDNRRECWKFFGDDLMR